jgi:hypothetical protein
VIAWAKKKGLKVKSFDFNIDRKVSKNLAVLLFPSYFAGINSFSLGLANTNLKVLLIRYGILFMSEMVEHCKRVS